MPELPEVETVVRTLRPHVIGRAIESVRVLRADVVRPATIALGDALPGRSITAIERRGKKILMSLDDGHRLCIHLGMTGRLTVEPADAPMMRHTHVVIGFVRPRYRGNGAAECRGALQDPHPVTPSRRHPVTFSPAQLRFRDPRRFGGVWWLCPGDSAERGLGPEPLTMSADDLRAALSRTRRAIKVALLDQKLVAGLGNIYVDEALFAAGVHPLKTARRLSLERVKRLNREIKAVLLKALRHRGSTLRDYVDANGGAGAFQKLHSVYGREGKACPRCGNPIRRIVLGGRSTHFCARCQKR